MYHNFHQIMSQKSSLSLPVYSYSLASSFIGKVLAPTTFQALYQGLDTHVKCACSLSLRTLELISKKECDTE